MVYKPTRGTAAAWATSSTVLADGQLGLARNADGTTELRFGDGTHTWPNLPRSNAVAKGELLINVKDAGAKCDGSTDDTTAWEAAISALNTSPASAAVHIYHPGGVSVVAKSSRLSAITKAGAGIVGEPSGSAQIKFTNASGGLDFGDGTNTVYLSRLQNLIVDGNGVCTLLVRMRKSEEAQWDTVRFQNTAATLVELNSTNLFFGKDLATSGGSTSAFLLSGSCGSLVFRGLNTYQATEVFRVSGSQLTNYVLKDAWIEASPDLITLNNSGNAISLGVVRVSDTYVLQTSSTQRLLRAVASSAINSGRVQFRDCYVNAASSTTALVDFTAVDNSAATFNCSMLDLDLNLPSLTHKLVEVHTNQSWFLWKLDMDNINGVASDKWIGTPLATGGTWPKPWRLFGSGSPASAVAAPRGSVYYRSDSAAATGLYVKETGDMTNTGWVAK